jgi:predicted nucleic acid-binding protein
VANRIIIDANIALKWVLPEDDSELAGSLLQAEIHAPDVLPVECCNALWASVRRGLLSADGARAGHAFILDAGMVLTPSLRLLPAALDLAMRLDHPVYDCLYLALIAETGAPLVTVDRGLIRAASRDLGLRDHVTALGL